MSKTPKPKALKMELDADADNLLEQLVASMKRIDEGLTNIHEMLARVLDAPGGPDMPAVRTTIR